MRYGVLLIGFEYIQTDKWKTLPGISVDLYQVYKYFSHITTNIKVFTDVDKDYRTSVLQKAILDGYVDSGLLSFVEDIKDQNQHSLYHSQKKNGYIMNNFDNVIKTFITDLDKLIIYYTGHAKGGNIILPDNTQVSLDYIREILTKTSPDSQILSILDCCQSSGMTLPYIWSDGIHRLNSHNFIRQRILCLSSSVIDEDSIATQSGSLFTRSLFSYLKNNKNNIITLDTLAKHMSNYTFIIHASYPNIKMLWSWITKEVHSNIDIDVGELITVTLENCHDTMEKSTTMKDYFRYHQYGRYDSIY